LIDVFVPKRKRLKGPREWVSVAIFIFITILEIGYSWV